MTKAAKQKKPIRRARAKTSTSANAPAAAAGGTMTGTGPGVTRSKPVTVRHYCQGIGDCHLLKFTKEDGGVFTMLIDCGVHSSVTGGNAYIERVVDDIAKELKPVGAGPKPRIDVVVATHEHWDHLSGFRTAAEKFEQFEFGEAWLGWTENPADPQARQLDKFKGQALDAIQASATDLSRASGLGPHLSAVREGLESVLGFHFGAKGERVRDARDTILKLTNGKVKYLEPKLSPLELPGVAGLRVHVLGPPRDPKLLGLTESVGEMYGIAGSGGWPIAVALGNAFGLGEPITRERGDFASPFDPNYGTPFFGLLAPGGPEKMMAAATGKNAEAEKKAIETIATTVRTHYSGQQPGPDGKPIDQSWRRIDNDWLGASADLAIQIDDRTNNSSLVLAFEFLDTGRVLLFVGDAQVGNWLSWQDLSWTIDGKQVTGPALLARTVYYKVGHHGSHNATLKAKGLELMASADLSAFIPTNENDAKKVKWGEMPYKGILDELERRCSQRVIRADDEWVARGAIPQWFRPPSGAIRSLRCETGLFVELVLA